MPETFTIQTGKTTSRWMKLLEYFQNSPRIAVRCVFKDEDRARKAYNRFKPLINKYSGRLTLAVCHSGKEVYIFKPEHFDVAVIVDEEKK